MTGAADPVLDAMLEDAAQTDPLYRPSRFWEGLNQQHLATLSSADGFAHFKRTLNERYFQFGFYAFPRAFPALLARQLRRPDPRVATARFERPTRARFASLLAPSIALYADAVATLRGGELLWTLDEPALGDPVVVRWGSRRTTQDLAHSVEEYLAVRNALPDRSFERVVELGAGYGRVAWVWLRTSPRARYVIVDIPPALYVAQRYLTSVLPDIPMFRYRPFARYAEVASEFERARLAFLLPHQLALLPAGHFDLFLTISTLHEMRPEQIANYLRLVDEKCAGAFYLKQWRSWRNPTDDVIVARDRYVMPPRWSLAFDRTPLLPREFFEALYVRGAG
jgi:putative sugar O-methyltransferase